MHPRQLDRRQREAIGLSLISLVAVLALRYPIEHRSILNGEVIAIVGLLVFSIYTYSDQSRWLGFLTRSLLAVTPIVFAFLCRSLGARTAFEMTALTTLGAASLAMATAGPRFRSMSLVSSGFLTLFATSISEYPFAAAPSIIWMTVCVWHLVANHWERIEGCSPKNVRRTGGIRSVSVIAAVALLLVGGFIAKDRFGDSQRFNWGFMPTSGGSEWSDPSALSGVGTGDAVIAATSTAESFGAVDSEIFLESTESTLYDMFTDSIGEPKMKFVVEKRQSLALENLQQSHVEASKSEKGGAFSTDRHAPEEKKHQHLDDVKQNALFQWSGETGIRLATNRYVEFDGTNWHNQGHQVGRKPIKTQVGENVWFFDGLTKSLVFEASTDQIVSGTVKVLRLNSTRIPLPMMASGVHIKDIDRKTFFTFRVMAVLICQDASAFPL